MVHTAELTYSPGRELIDAFIHLPSTQYYSQEKTYWNGSLKEKYGLTFRIKKIGNDRAGFISIRMICRINFKKLISENPSRDAKVDVMTVSDINAVVEKFNMIARRLCPLMPKFDDWMVNRIDYCINVYTDFVEDYLNLLKKGDRPYLKDWYDRQGNYSQKPGSLYLVSTAKKKRSRGITVNFYNKQDEIRKSMGISENEVELDQIDEVIQLAENILRLEIQCHRPKTEYLKKKYNMPKKEVRYFLNPEIAYGLIERYLLRIAGAADYNRKSVALQLVKQTSCRQETKDKMAQIIVDVAKQHSSIAKVRDKYAEAGIMTKEEFGNLIRKMHGYGINPVTIRDNKKIKGKKLKEGLISLTTLFENAREAEMTINPQKPRVLQ